METPPSGYYLSGPDNFLYNALFDMHRGNTAEDLSFLDGICHYLTGWKSILTALIIGAISSIRGFGRTLSKVYSAGTGCKEVMCSHFI